MGASAERQEARDDPHRPLRDGDSACEIELIGRTSDDRIVACNFRCQATWRGATRANRSRLASCLRLGDAKSFSVRIVIRLHSMALPQTIGRLMLFVRVAPRPSSLRRKADPSAERLMTELTPQCSRQSAKTGRPIFCSCVTTSQPG